MTLTQLPVEILTDSVLPYIDHFDQGRLYQVSKLLQQIVIKFLTTNKVLDMASVSRKLELGDLAMAATRKKAAFDFLTKGTICLRRLTIDDHEAMPVTTVAKLKKFIKINPNLSSLSLVNVKLTNAAFQAIVELPKLKYLKVSPDACPAAKGDGKELKSFIEKLEGKGCELDYHYDTYSMQDPEAELDHDLNLLI